MKRLKFHFVSTWGKDEESFDETNSNVQNQDGKNQPPLPKPERYNINGINNSQRFLCVSKLFWVLHSTWFIWISSSKISTFPAAFGGFPKGDWKWSPPSRVVANGRGRGAKSLQNLPRGDLFCWRTVDGSEIRRSPVEVVEAVPLFARLYTSQQVVGRISSISID